MNSKLSNSFVPSLAQIAPSSAQSTGTGRITVMSLVESGSITICQWMLLGLSSCLAALMVPPVTVMACQFRCTQRSALLASRSLLLPNCRMLKWQRRDNLLRHFRYSALQPSAGHVKRRTRLRTQYRPFEFD